MIEKKAAWLLLVFVLVMFSGCSEQQLPAWLKFGQKQTALPMPQPAQPAAVQGTALASINGRIITLEEFNDQVKQRNTAIEAAKDIPDEVKSNYLIKTQADKEELLEGMVERELIVSEAITRGVDKAKDAQKAMEAFKKQYLIAKLVELERDKVEVQSKEVENYYNLYSEVFKIPEERRISMIVISAEDKAKELMISLLQGNDFSALARGNSIDSKSAGKGGDVGFIVQKTPLIAAEQKTMFEKFEHVAFSLELNTPSNIFQGPDGYYIIKVTEIKPARQKQISEVYSDIEQGLLLKKQEEALTSLIGNLRKTANVIIHDELLRE